MEYVHAFWVGGLICAAVQILMDRTKLMPGRIMVLLVCTGAVLGFLNIYRTISEICRSRSERTAPWIRKSYCGKVSKRRLRRRVSGNLYGWF